MLMVEKSQSGHGATKLVQNFLRRQYKQCQLLYFLIYLVNTEPMLAWIHSHFKFINLKEWIVGHIDFVGYLFFVNCLTLILVFRHLFFDLLNTVDTVFRKFCLLFLLVVNLQEILDYLFLSFFVLAYCFMCELDQSSIGEIAIDWLK